MGDAYNFSSIPVTGWKVVDGGAPMFRKNTVGSARHRPRASTACNNCRRRKVKCDVQKIAHGEACTKCRKANVDCIVSHNSDRRRFGSHRHVAFLQDRLQSLEAFITEHPRRHSDAREQLIASNDHEKGLSSSLAVDTGSEPSSSCNHMSRMVSSQDTEPSTFFSIPGAGTLPIAGCRLQKSEIPKLLRPDRQHSGLSNTPNISSSAADNANLLACTPGGAAHLHSIPHGATCSSPEHGLTSRSSAELEIQLSGAEEDIGIEAAVSPDSSQVQKVLLEIAWRYPSLQPWLVNEEHFQSHRQLGIPSQYYSPFLENALLACASRASTSSAIRKLGSRYIDRAMKTIHVELEDPTPATVQGFLLLADFETSRGRDRQAWTYIGTACREIMFDLGHKELNSTFTRDCPAPLNVHYQSVIYLSAFVYDTLWSLHLSQPRAISFSMLSTVRDSVPKTAQSRMLHVWVDLCVHIAEISNIIYINPLLDSYSRAHLLQSEQRLQSHYDALPPDLSYRRMSVGELDTVGYTYHMQFYSARIVLHRALLQSILGRGHENPLPLDDTGQYTPSSLANFIYESAVHITNLVLNYKQIFGPDKMVPVMVYSIYMAATSLVSHVLYLQGLGTLADKDVKRIRYLFDTLSQSQEHFPVASRMCRTILEGFGANSLGCTGQLHQRQDKLPTHDIASSQVNHLEPDNR